ncbi:MAG: formylglycine-generating enzyme family protein, partial [Desulfovibrio sp.]|nr:formylglycine-generating enzyme family protein [Desulfovibrio sp.]
MGLVNVPVDLRNIYEKKREGYIAGSFTAANLPESWKKTLNAREAKKDEGIETWYFIGKYELTNRQWESVMNALDKDGAENPDACPAPGAKNANQPVSGVTWFDVQEFLNKYNAWLVKNHSAELPSFGETKNIAFFRLPTEEEWEYAARGGAKVDADWWTSHDIFPADEGKTIRDYGIYQDGGPNRSAPATIGSRNANPLGLHDTAGNVREMVDGFFRMTVPDYGATGSVQGRLHGSVGGFLSKGGSYLSSEEDIMPGAREEHPLYTARGAFSADDLGLRLALAGLNIPDGERKEKLLAAQKEGPQTQEPKQAAAPQHTPDVMGQAPIQALETLAASADDALKKNLLNIREKLKDEKSAQETENERRLEHSLRALLYQAETLRAWGLRYASITANIAKIGAVKKKSADPRVQKEADSLLASGKRDQAEYLKTLEMSANYYKTSLELIYRQGAQDAERILSDLRKGYDAKTIFGDHMLQNIEILEKFIKQARSKGVGSLTQRAILRGILPEDQYNILPKG